MRNPVKPDQVSFEVGELNACCAIGVAMYIEEEFEYEYYDYDPFVAPAKKPKKKPLDPYWVMDRGLKESIKVAKQCAYKGLLLTEAKRITKEKPKEYHEAREKALIANKFTKVGSCKGSHGNYSVEIYFRTLQKGTE